MKSESWPKYFLETMSPSSSYDCFCCPCYDVTTTRPQSAVWLARSPVVETATAKGTYWLKKEITFYMWILTKWWQALESLGILTTVGWGPWHSDSCQEQHKQETVKPKVTEEIPGFWWDWMKWAMPSSPVETGVLDTGLSHFVGPRSFCQDKVGFGIRVASQVPLLHLLIVGLWTSYPTLGPPLSLLWNGIIWLPYES